jgi:hypothetical protein
MFVQTAEEESIFYSIKKDGKNSLLRLNFVKNSG